MSRTQKKIDIFLTVSRSTINQYFNPHDPAPIYKRQLRQDVITYISDAVTTYTRHSIIRYKISCNKEDKDLVEPFMHAINRHYQVKEELMKKEFEKFKKRSVRLLFMSLAVIMVCHGLLPLVEVEEHGIGSTVTNSVDVFSWVILWKPIDRLIFGWNPYLKDISLLHKLATAEVIVMEYASAALELEPKLKVSA
jgi:hypothetical protein